jgi:hypothetical protein
LHDNPVQPTFFGAEFHHAIRIKEDRVALTINHSSTNGKSLLIKLGVTKEAIAELLSKGWDVKLTAKSLSFIKTGDHEHHVPIDLTTLNAISTGTVSMVVKAKIVQDVKGAMQAALLGMPGAPLTQPVPAADLGPGDTTGMTFVQTGLGKAKAVQQAAVQPAQIAGGKWPMFDPKKLKIAPLIKLRDATHMYQPVSGTSHGSRYFLVAANDGVRVAARLAGGTLSVRIEGDAWKQHQAAILACGFDNHGAAKDYTSLHVTVGDNSVLANKTLGAILTGLGIPFETPIPNVKVIGE